MPRVCHFAVLVVVVFYSIIQIPFQSEKTTSPRHQAHRSSHFPQLACPPTFCRSAGKSQDGRRRMKVCSSPQHEVVSETESLRRAFVFVLF